MIDFDMGSLSKEQLEQALLNSGYSFRSCEFPNAGIERIEHVHPKTTEQQEWMYEVVFKDDGSFHWGDDRRAKLFVKFNPVTLQVVAEF